MEKGQSKFRSLIEANVNTLVGFVLTLVFSPLFYHLVGMEYTYKQLGIVTLLFTLLSVARGYVIRRIFNKSEKEKESHWVKQLKSLQDQLQRMRDVNNNWANLYAKQRRKLFVALEELDMCKHLHTAAVSDIVEGADYYPSEERTDKQRIEDGN